MACAEGVVAAMIGVAILIIQEERSIMRFEGLYGASGRIVEARCKV